MQNITFKKAILNFPNYLYKENKAESTTEAYVRDLDLFKDFLVHKLNNKIRTLDKITLIEIEQYKYFLLDKVKSSTFKRITASRKFNALKTFFAYLQNEYGIKNIIYGDDWGNKNRNMNWEEEGENYLPEILDIEDLEDLINTIENSIDKNKFRDMAIIQTLVSTGCRRSELLNLKWHHINFYRSEIKIIRPKTKNANVIKMTDEMRKALETYRNTLEVMGDYVFKSRQSNKLSKSAFNSIIVKWVNVSGIQKQKNYKITAHTFRHTFITLCIRANIPDTKIIEYTGHKDINSLDVYKHLCTTDYNDIINAVNIGSNTLKRVI